MEKGCSNFLALRFFLHQNCVTETVLRVSGPLHVINGRTKNARLAEGRKGGKVEGYMEEGGCSAL